MRTRSAHPVSRPLPFRSLQELRRHLNCCFQLIYFYHNFQLNAIPLTDGLLLCVRLSMMAVTYQPPGGARSVPILREAIRVAAQFLLFVPFDQRLEATLEA